MSPLRGVLGIVPITNFRKLCYPLLRGFRCLCPLSSADIRMRCAIHSENAGSVMVIPRKDKLVRLYIQITTTEKEGNPVRNHKQIADLISDRIQVERAKIGPEMILNQHRRSCIHTSWRVNTVIGGPPTRMVNELVPISLLMNESF